MVCEREGSGLQALPVVTSTNLSTRSWACLFIAVLNQFHSQRPISLQKNSFAKKPEKMRIASVFSPIFRLTGRALEGAVIAVTVE